jgi:hypothetical protein
MKIYLAIFFLISTAINGIAQSNFTSIVIAPLYNKMPVKLNKSYAYLNDTIQITRLKFYISDIAFYNNDKLIALLTKKYFLIDVENPSSLVINTSIDKSKPYNKICFNVGIDSITNVSGIMGADLDPINGMYWTWQSGYINFKLEGKSNICPTKNHHFIFHIGGYQHPFNTLQKCCFNVVNQKKVVINIDLSKLLQRINLKELYHVMSTNNSAVEIAKKIADVIYIAQ